MRGKRRMGWAMREWEKVMRFVCSVEKILNISYGCEFYDILDHYPLDLLL